MIVRLDERGRVCIPKAMREKTGNTFFIVETQRGILLVPVPSDPVKQLAEIGRKIPELSIEELRRAIAEQAQVECA
ncbi:MAG: AbrB family transcriptional regulator [Candidatus Thorarchaeota archaeon]|nr:AbrB family transcriptional regulator [Candidatus Thorarchaeota archaeon]